MVADGGSNPPSSTNIELSKVSKIIDKSFQIERKSFRIKLILSLVISLLWLIASSLSFVASLLGCATSLVPQFVFMQIMLRKAQNKKNNFYKALLFKWLAFVILTIVSILLIKLDQAVAFVSSFALMVVINFITSILQIKQTNA